MASILATLVAGAFIAILPGRTASHARVDLDAITVAPRPDGFQLDGLHWDRDAFRSDARLDGFRVLMGSTCAGRKGLAAAICVSNVLQHRFPYGKPAREFLDAAYEPSSDLEAHLGGEPGHCVTRSGLTATALLASGIAARQVQIDWGKGHSIVEVFDDTLGWVMFDPSYGLTYGTADKPLSVAAALNHGSFGITKVADAAGPAPSESFQITEALYPDPWLYTRSGERAATWPFRGRFVHAGSASLHYGLAQQIARTLFVFLGLTSVLALVASRRKRSASRASLDVRVATEPVASSES